MKTVSANAQAELDKRFGNEPLIIVEIEWSAGSISRYCDRDIDNLSGRILDLSTIETVLTPKNVQSASVGVTLDDIDGTIKDVTDEKDVHKRPCTISLYFGDLSALSDRITLFKGQISTPFSWAESSREVAFQVVSEIENFEVGFSPEESQLDFVSEDLVGKPWPLCFGNVRHVPAQQVKQIAQAKLLERFCLVDQLLYKKLELLGLAYQREAFMLNFWGLVRVGVHKLVPPVWWTLREYVKIILAEDNIIFQIFKQQKLISDLKTQAQIFPFNLIFRAAIQFAIQGLRVLGRPSQLIQARKKWLEDVIKLTEFAYNAEKNAVSKMIEAHNNMRTIYADFLKTNQEICFQLECFSDKVLVQDVDVFEDDTPVDILLNKVRFRVKFDHANNQMCFLDGPMDTLVAPAIQPWKEDDEPCLNVTEMDGLNLFWLQDDPAPNLEGCFLLVKKRGTDDEDGQITRHILKVEKQENQKVYFKLVAWDKEGSGNSNRQNSLENVINQTVNPPGGWVLGPFGTAVPRGMFTGQLDPAIWNRPESALLLQILSLIPGGVNEKELRNLAKLVYMLPFDQLQGFIILTPGPREIYTIIGQDIERIDAVSGMVPRHWLNEFELIYEELPDSTYFEAEAGTTIRPHGPDCEIFIANLLPSTVKAVHAL